MQRRLASFCFAALAMAALGGFAHAQGAFPSKPVKFIVPFPAGGINDVLARIAADKLQAKWGQPIIIEQKTGAGGNIGADLAAQAEPDGYTLFVAPPGPLAINGSLYKKLSYKPEDFVPMTVLGSVPNVTIVKKELPVNSLKELVDYIKNNPGKVVYGSQGNGATPHLTANMFMTMTGTNMVHVPYRGETLVLQDMLGGHVDLFFGNVSAALALWRDGKVKVLAVLDKKRSAQMPDVPTTGRGRHARSRCRGWFAVAGPPKMAPALRDRIARDFIEVLKMPDVQAKYRALSVEPGGHAGRNRGLHQGGNAHLGRGDQEEQHRGGLGHRWGSMQRSMRDEGRKFLKWLDRTPVQTFVLCPSSSSPSSLRCMTASSSSCRGDACCWPGAIFNIVFVGRYRQPRAGGSWGIDIPPDRIVATGPYRYTRNPMYLGHLIFMLGLAITFWSWFALILLVAAQSGFTAASCTTKSALPRDSAATTPPTGSM